MVTTGAKRGSRSKVATGTKRGRRPKPVCDRQDLMFTIRFSALEMERFSALAEHYGLARADVFRLLLKRDHDRVYVYGGKK